MAKSRKRQKKDGSAGIAGSSTGDYVHRLEDAVSRGTIWMQNSQHPEMLIGSVKNTLWALREHCSRGNLDGSIVVSSLATTLRELEEIHKGALVLQRRENLARQMVTRLLNAPITVTTPAGAVAWEVWKKETLRLLEETIKSWNPAGSNTNE